MGYNTICPECKKHELEHFDTEFDHVKMCWMENWVCYECDVTVSVVAEDQSAPEDPYAEVVAENCRHL